MRLLHFLNEKYEHIEDATKILQTKCKNNLKHTLENDAILFRGDKELIKDTYIFKKTKRLHIANNSYIQVLNRLPSWQNIPKRSNSLICSTKFDMADDYGHVFVVIPYDNAQIIKSPVHDFWYILNKHETLPLISLSISFKNDEFTRYYIPTNTKITNFLNLTLLELVNKYCTDIWSTSIVARNIYLAATYKKLNTSQIEVRNTTKENLLKYIENKKTLQNIKLIDVYDYYFNPAALKLETISYSQLFNHFGNHECWTDSPCILIHDEYYQSHIKELKELIR